MKILVFGGSGQVGRELQRSLCPLADIVVPGFSEVPRVDFKNPDALTKCISTVMPDMVVNAAAYTAVDQAENDKASADLVNAQAPGVIGRAAAAIGAPVIHYSTDYVFGGDGLGPWREVDEVAPVNYYGKSKLEGERQLMRASPHSLVFRTSWVYSLYGKNFPKTMLRLAKEKDQLTIVDDQIGTPTSAPFLADVTACVIKQISQASNFSGIYHLAASGETSWFGFADFLLTRAEEMALISRKPGLAATNSAAYTTPAKRQLNSRLDTNKIRTTFGIRIPLWQQGVEQFLQSIIAAKS